MSAAAVGPLGEQLLTLRRERGLTLRELVDGGELTWQAVSKIERGERDPKTSTLIVLARTLGVTFVVDGDGVRIKT